MYYTAVSVYMMNGYNSNFYSVLVGTERQEAPYKATSAFSVLKVTLSLSLSLSLSFLSTCVIDFALLVRKCLLFMATLYVCTCTNVYNIMMLPFYMCGWIHVDVVICSKSQYIDQ